MKVTPNATAWVDRNLSRYWGAIEEAAPGVDWLPRATVKPQRSGGIRVRAEEFGCGHYGCVMPTNRAERVFKMTSDVAEAAFVRAALEIGEFPAGIVSYDSIYELKGAKHRKRPVFVLWRQEAHEIGFLLGMPAHVQARTWQEREAMEALNLVLNTQIAGGITRQWLEKGKSVDDVRRYSQMAWNIVAEHVELLEKSSYGYGSWADQLTVEKVIRRYRGAERAAVALRFFEAGAEMMYHNNPLATNVGHALSFYLEHGILLADVHGNNIGKATHEDYEGAVVSITDPGHAVFLDDRYDGLKIEELDPSG